MTTHYRSCSLCEAGCGVTVVTEGERVVSVRGDDADPFSRGYICPKGTALADLHADPDRLQRPLMRDGTEWREVEWETALDFTARRLAEVRAAHGADGIAVFQGNPTVHNFGLMTFGQLFFRTLGTKHSYSSTSLDQLPHMLAALLMFGNQILMPVPDLDRTDLFVCLGANPVASNGSIMTAPGIKDRLAAVRARGGRVVVIDPRRTETAAAGGEHLFIRPGTDAVFLLAVVHELFAADLVRPTPVPLTGVGELRAAAAAWPPERAAAITGISATQLRELVHAFATTKRAVWYGRVGVCTQEFGGLAAWLCYAVNALAGHLDEVGGLMFTTPAVDPLPLANLVGYDGGFARWTSRVSHKPEFGGELPMGVLAEEMETPGAGQIRALITSAGNPVLSAPGGPRLERALAQLDFMVSIDPYLNETTRHAHVILPPTSTLERSHYDLALNAFAVRNVAKYSPPLFPRAAHARHDWEICVGLWTRMGGARASTWSRLPGPLRRSITAIAGGGGKLAARVIGALGPEAILALGLRLGPHRLSLGDLKRAPHGLDLGALVPRLPDRLSTKDRTVHLAPAVYLADLERLETRYAHAASNELVLIGRRHLRSNNSWMHNSERLVKGPSRCTLLIHPRDAAARGITEGALATVSTRTGTLELAAEITDAMMPGVVSIPHGWGHTRAGTRLRVASTVPGVSVNDLLDPSVIDELSGTAALTGQRVEVVLAGGAA